LLADVLGEPVSDHLPGNADSDGKWRYVFADYGACADRRSGPDRHARQDNRSVPDPHVVSQHYCVRASPVEEGRVIFLRELVALAAISEVMKCHPFHRMIAGIDPSMCRDGAKFANLSVDDAGVIDYIGIIAHHAFGDCRAGTDCGPRTEIGIAYVGCGMD